MANIDVKKLSDELEKAVRDTKAEITELTEEGTEQAVLKAQMLMPAYGVIGLLSMALKASIDTGEQDG